MCAFPLCLPHGPLDSPASQPHAIQHAPTVPLSLLLSICRRMATGSRAPAARGPPYSFFLYLCAQNLTHLRPCALLLQSVRVPKASRI
eukprot:238691-Chlamydomonas_euryale.AAC.1